MLDRLLYAEEIAERYRVSRRKAMEMLREMPSIKLGNQRAISEKALAAWEQAKVAEPKKAPKKSGRKARVYAPVVQMQEMRCPRRRELREMEKAARAAR